MSNYSWINKIIIFLNYIFPITLNESDTVPQSDFMKVNQYLKHLTSVQSVTVQQVYPDHVIFSIQISGDKQLLTQAIAIDNVLLPETSINTNNTEMLVYRVKSA